MCSRFADDFDAEGVSPRHTTDELFSVCVNRLHREKRLLPGASTVLRCTGGTVLIGCDGEIVSFTRFALLPSDADTPPIEIARAEAELAWTDCHLGGRRPWFECPYRECGRRVGKLCFAAGGRVACRHCFRLGYESRRLRPLERGLYRAGRIREQLGGGPSLLEPFPEKPPTMRWRRYHALEAEVRDLEWVYLSSRGAEFERFAQRARHQRQRGL